MIHFEFYFPKLHFFGIFVRHVSRWFFPSLSQKKKTFVGGKLSWLKKLYIFASFAKDKLKWLQLFPTFACDKSKATFASGKSRWLKKSEYIFANFVGDKFRWLQLSRLVLAINRDDCSFLRLLVAINRNECIFLRLLLAINQDNCMYFFFRKPYSGLQLRAYGDIRYKTNENDY